MRWITRKGTFTKFVYLKCRVFSQWKGEVSVYRSLSHNPFENLAFEDWLYLNADFTNRRILYLWRNEPTVVIGRHQNPWVECSLRNLQECHVHLARRKSGGGTVYHDLGNVNLSFFTPRKLYNRKENLALIVRVLRERWKLDVEASPRDDILVDGNFKISGSSSKLGAHVAFHHCTLLLDADECLLQVLLQPSYTDICSRATQSVSSSIMNLSTKDQSIKFETVTEAVAEQFCHTYAPGKDVKIIEIDPCYEQQFPGIMAMKEEHQDWQWVYGKTPRFTVIFSTILASRDISIKITSYHGLVENTEIHCHDQAIQELFTDLVGGLKGVKFEVADFETALVTCVNSASLTALDRQLCYLFIQWITCSIF